MLLSGLGEAGARALGLSQVCHRCSRSGDDARSAKTPAFATVRGGDVRKLATLGITLLGLWVIVHSVTSFVYALQAPLVFGGDLASVAGTVALGLLSTSFVAGAGILLVARRERLAASLFDDDGDGVHLAADPTRLVHLGVLLLGAGTAVAGFKGLLEVFLFAATTNLSESAMFGSGDLLVGPDGSYLPQVIVNASELLLGAGIAWFSGPIATFLWSHRWPRSQPEEEGAHPDDEDA